MANRIKTDFNEFANDLYDLMGMNGITQEEFFHKYVITDKAFMVDNFTNFAVIYFDDFDISIRPKH